MGVVALRPNSVGHKVSLPPAGTLTLEPRYSGLVDIRAAAFGDPDAVDLIAGVRQEYLVRLRK